MGIKRRRFGTRVYMRDSRAKQAGSETGAPRSVKIRAAHEVVAARAAELALLVLQFMPAARTPAPVFAVARLRFRRRGFRLHLALVRLWILLWHTRLLGVTSARRKETCTFNFASRRVGSHWIRSHGNRAFPPACEIPSLRRTGSGLFRSFPAILPRNLTPALALLRSWHVQHEAPRPAKRAMPISRRPPCGDGQPTNIPLTRAGRSRLLLGL